MIFVDFIGVFEVLRFLNVQNIQKIVHKRIINYISIIYRRKKPKLW